MAMEAKITKYRKSKPEDLRENTHKEQGKVEELELRNCTRGVYMGD